MPATSASGNAAAISTPYNRRTRPTRLSRGAALRNEKSALLNRLELFERLPAARAVPDRTARRRAEDVLELRLRRPAVRAPMDDRLQLDESGSRRCESRCAQLLAAGGRDLVRSPGVVVHDLDVRPRPELADLLLERALHRLERGTAEEGRRELHMDML